MPSADAPDRDRALTIGEIRRSGRPHDRSDAGDQRLLTAALTEVRTEQAPDVSDVQVTVKIAFVVKT